MILSHKYKFIFIHIPKTGGSSFTKILADNLHRHCGGRGWQSKFHQSGLHSTSRQNIKVIKLYPGYFKLSFVRNPWDRFVSMCHSRLEMGVPNQAKRSMEYILQYLDEHGAAGPFPLQQYSYLVVGKQLALDYLARHENYESECASIAARVGLEVAEVPKVLFTGRVDYRSYYTDKTAELCAKVFSKDIGLLGYSF